jgi:uncharacterized protein DUF3750
MTQRRGKIRNWIVAGVIGLVLIVIGCAPSRDWRTASQEPVGLAPDPATTPEAVVQVYAARTVGWKGAFGVHTWIAVKPSGAKPYTVYEVIGWRLRWTDSALAVRERAPDARWFGAEPELIAERRGPGVDALIGRIEKAAKAYPWAGDYTLWPGPNSNTFTAWVLRSVPELGADLPPTAIGKDYLGARVIASAPSGNGLQVSLYGLAGVTASRVEGLEFNVLGLTFGINPFDLSLKLPLVGRLGPARTNHAPAPVGTGRQPG